MRACERCGGWRLRAFGFGIEKIEEDVREFVKKQKIKTKILRLDSTLKLTPKKIQELVLEYFSESHAVLIATEIALPYLFSSSHHIDVSCIPSPDSLLALPDFNINQKLWRLLAMLDEVSKTAVIVQTRNPQHKLLEDWENNNEKDFKIREDAERKQFMYPPYSVMIKISLKGNKEKVGKDMKIFENQITKWKPIVFPAFIKTINNMHILHLIVSVPAKSWPDQDLLDVLLSLPPSFEINVNPNSLL
jgi:primosomal protein N' (replication factor Y)